MVTRTSWKEPAATLAWLLPVTIAAVLLQRRLIGAIEPVTGAGGTLVVFVFSAILLAAGATWYRYSSKRDVSQLLGRFYDGGKQQLLFGIAAALPALLFAAALLTANAFIMLVLVGAATAAAWQQFDRLLPRVVFVEQSASLPLDSDEQFDITACPDPEGKIAWQQPDESHEDLNVLSEDAEPLPDELEGLVLSLTRRQQADGSESLEAVLRIDFAAGERLAHVHLPLIPPWPHPPAVQCELLDAEDVRLRIAATYNYGLRIEARRTDPQATGSVLVGVMIDSAANAAAA